MQPEYPLTGFLPTDSRHPDGRIDPDVPGDRIVICECWMPGVRLEISILTSEIIYSDDQSLISVKIP
jgi:hypothetical protein